MEQTLLATVQVFADELRRLDQQKLGADLSISLTLSNQPRYSDKKAPILNLEACFLGRKNHQTVVAATIESLMDEVYRRLDYTDRENMCIAATEATLVQLPAPESVSCNTEDMPF